MDERHGAGLVAEHGIDGPVEVHEPRILGDPGRFGARRQAVTLGLQARMLLQCLCVGALDERHRFGDFGESRLEGGEGFSGVRWGSEGGYVWNRIFGGRGHLGDDLSHQQPQGLLASRQLGLTFPVGDADALAERICWAADHPREIATMAEDAQRYAQEHLTFEATTRELVAWAAKPTFAPDVGFKPGNRKADPGAA